MSGLMGITAAAVLVLLGCGAANADDWTATKLRGSVLTARGQQWVPLTRGETVADGQAVRTMSNGYVEFGRGDETITLAANTQLQLKERRGGTYTAVAQYSGQVTIQDDHTALPHFEVDTPYIAAVVKGTVFTVYSGPKSTRVDVKEGEVQVSDQLAHTSVLITANQHASAGLNQPLSAGGSGPVAPMKNKWGQVVPTQSIHGQVVAISGVPAGNQPSPNGSAQQASPSDNGKGNAGVPGNGRGEVSDGGVGAGKSDNGRGNGGVPGDGGASSGNGNSGSGSNASGNSNAGNGNSSNGNSSNGNSGNGNSGNGSPGGSNSGGGGGNADKNSGSGGSGNGGSGNNGKGKG